MHCSPEYVRTPCRLRTANRRSSSAADDAVEEVAIRIVPSRDTAPVGATLDLTCQVTGAEGTRASWRRVDAPLPAGAIARANQLRLTELTADDGGLYRCTVMTRGGAEYAEDYVLAIQGGRRLCAPLYLLTQAGRW